MLSKWHAQGDQSNMTDKLLFLIRDNACFPVHLALTEKRENILPKKQILSSLNLLKQIIVQMCLKQVLKIL